MLIRRLSFLFLPLEDGFQLYHLLLPSGCQHFMILPLGRTQTRTRRPTDTHGRTNTHTGAHMRVPSTCKHTNTHTRTHRKTLSHALSLSLDFMHADFWVLGNECLGERYDAGECRVWLALWLSVCVLVCVCVCAPMCVVSVCTYLWKHVWVGMHGVRCMCLSVCHCVWVNLYHHFQFLYICLLQNQLLLLHSENKSMLYNLGKCTAVSPTSRAHACSPLGNWLEKCMN